MCYFDTPFLVAMNNDLLDVAEKTDRYGNPACILITDDNRQLVELLREYLGDTCSVLSDGDNHETPGKVEIHQPRLVVLDIVKPGLESSEVINRLRGVSEIPVIMLSAGGETEDRIKSLSPGVENYFINPSATEELLDRISILLEHGGRDAPPPATSSFTFGDFFVNFEKRRVSISGRNIRLTQTEFTLLKELLLNKGKILTYDFLLQSVWGPEYRTEREYLHVYVNRLRSKLDFKDGGAIRIINIPRTGYCLKLKE